MIPITESLARFIFFTELWHLAALFFTITINTLLYRSAKKSSLLKRYLILQAALLLWIVSKMLKTVAPVEMLRWAMIVSQFIAVAFLGTLFLEFAWEFRFARRISPWIRQPLYVLSFLYFLAVCTNPLHHQIYSYYDFYTDIHGKLFFFCSFFTYIQVVSAIILCLMGVAKRRTAMNGFLIALAAFFPLIINVLYLFKIIRPLFDVTPIVMTGSLSLFAIAAWKFNFLSPLPVVKQVLLDTLGDPILVTDSKNRVLTAHIFTPDVVPSAEIRQRDKIYHLYAVKNIKLKKIWFYCDITFLISLREKIKEQNAALEDSIARIAEKNKSRLKLIEHDCVQRSRRALHDILGHSITLVLYILRVERKRSQENKPHGETITQCRKLIEEAMENLDKKFCGSADSETILSFTLQKFVDNYTEIDTDIDLAIGGSERPLNPQRVHLICDIIREAITNAIRHGKAERVMLSVLFGSEGLLVSIADTGKGCDVCTPGNGLTMMGAAIKTAGGCLRFISEPNQGFQLTVQLPYQE